MEWTDVTPDTPADITWCLIWQFGEDGPELGYRECNEWMRNGRRILDNKVWKYAVIARPDGYDAMMKAEREAEAALCEDCRSEPWMVETTRGKMCRECADAEYDPTMHDAAIGRV
jgi:hypothetical protein